MAEHIENKELVFQGPAWAWTHGRCGLVVLLVNYFTKAVYWTAVNARAELPGCTPVGTDAGAGASQMPKDVRRFSLTRTAQAFQENVSRAGPAASASYTLVGGIILLGGLGFWADRWLGTAPWLLVAGLTLGIVVGFYEIVKSTLRG